jgi:hypothetical protein
MANAELSGAEPKGYNDLLRKRLWMKSLKQNAPLKRDNRNKNCDNWTSSK